MLINERRKLRRRILGPLTATSIMACWSLAFAASNVVRVNSLAEALNAPVDKVLEFINPVTGKRRSPTPAEIKAITERARKLPHAGSLPRLQRYMLENGLIMIHLPPEYMEDFQHPESSIPNSHQPHDRKRQEGEQ